jgi:predicted DNA-binding transcriptional regulator AlpA
MFLDPFPGTELLTAKQVQLLIGLERSQFLGFRRADQTFPRPIVLRTGGSRWRKSEVLEWIIRQVPLAPDEDVEDD